MFGWGFTLLIKCLHGFFIFEEQRAGQISQFMSLFEGLEIVSNDAGIFTFASLVEAPSHSLEGGEYLEAPVLKTFEGEPWEIMRENGLVYNFDLDEVVPIESITQRVTLFEGQDAIFSPGLILPGSLTDEGERVTDYAAWFLFDQNRFKYSEVISE